ARTTAPGRASWCGWRRSRSEGRSTAEWPWRTGGKWLLPRGRSGASIPSMKRFRVTLAVALLAAAIGSIVPVRSSQDNPKALQATNLSGLHDFDFLVGRWQVHHRRLKERLANSHEWVEFDGTCSNFPLMGGWGNVDDNVLNLPGDNYRGVGLRSYDPK